MPGNTTHTEAPRQHAHLLPQVLTGLSSLPKWGGEAWSWDRDGVRDKRPSSEIAEDVRELLKKAALEVLSTSRAGIPKRLQDSLLLLLLL